MTDNQKFAFEKIFKSNWLAVQNLRLALRKAVFALGFKKPSVITLWELWEKLFVPAFFLSSFEKSCLSQKLFVTHFSVGNRVKVETRKQGLAIDKYQFRTAAKR